VNILIIRLRPAQARPNRHCLTRWEDDGHFDVRFTPLVVTKLSIYRELYALTLNLASCERNDQNTANNHFQAFPNASLNGEISEASEI
jgi:hypothetical protein